MKALVAKEAKYRRSGGAGHQCLQCRRVIKDGQAVLAQSRNVSYNGYSTSSYQVTDYWHRSCIEGLLKKTEDKMLDASGYVPPADRKAKLEEDFNALRDQLAAGSSSLLI